MTKSQKYLEALNSFDDWLVVSKWATKVEKIYSDLLEKANEQIAKHENKTTEFKVVTIARCIK